MFKADLEKRRIGDKCYICGKVLEKTDEVREVFDKAFGANIRMCKKHYFFGEEQG